jgi:membrane protein
MGSVLPVSAFLMEAVNFVVSFAVITLLFAAIFKIIPDIDNTWSDVWIGALATAALFTVGKSMIGIYIGRTALDSTYGAAASLVVVLVWIYYSSLILFLGAEFTHVYAQRRGSQTGATDASRLQPAAKRESQATARAASR